MSRSIVAFGCMFIYGECMGLAAREVRVAFLFSGFCVHGSISILLKGGVLRGLVYPGREEKRAVCGVIGWLLCVSPARAGGLFVGSCVTA